MIILKQLMEKMLTLHEEFQIRKFEIRSISHFYKCFSLAIHLLGIEDPNLRKRNSLWKMMLVCQEMGKTDIYYYSKLKVMMSKDWGIIVKALTELEKEVEASDEEGDYWSPGSVGTLDYEVEFD